MLNSEFKNEFNIHYNSIATMSAPSIDDYEISVYLTKAQLELVKDYYNPEGNKYKKGFEGSEKRRVDLKELVKNYVSTDIIPSSSNIDVNSKFFKIPDDVFLIVYENGKILSNDCSNGKKITITPVTHDEYNVRKDNPFKKPDQSVIWRLDISNIGDNKVVELLSNYEITEYQLRYIQYPKPIIISDLVDLYPSDNLSIDGFTSEQPCLLSESIHREILDRAVELALNDYKPQGLENKIQLDSRNE